MKTKTILLYVMLFAVIMAVDAKKKKPKKGDDDDSNSKSAEDSDSKSKESESKESDEVEATTLSTTTKAPKDKEKEENEKKRISVPGNYILKTDPDNDQYCDYLKAMGYDEEDRKKMRKTKKVIVGIKKLNDTHWSIKHQTEETSNEYTFESGKERVERLADGRKINSTITIDDKEKKAFKLMRMKKFDATNNVTFSRLGFNVTFTAKDKSATLEFLRADPVKKFFENIGEAFKNFFKG